MTSGDTNMTTTTMTPKEKKAAKLETLNASIKQMKQSGDLENFYRFIHDNNLRNEGHKLMQSVLDVIKPKRKTRKIKKLH